MPHAENARVETDLTHADEGAPWFVFPVILGGALCLAAGLESGLGSLWALVIANAAAVLAISVAEHRWPHYREWNRPHGDIGTDVLHALISGIGTTQLVRILVDVSIAGAAMALSNAVGGSLWPRTWPLALQLALALVVAEFAQYWLHRWQHEHEALWRFHAVHHSAPRLYWLNAARFHPIDVGLLYAFGYVPLVLLGCPPSVIAMFALFDAVFGMLQHCNVGMRLGPLNWIFSAAEPHRWHHSRTLDEANTNYGSNLIVWDLVFGTFFLPQDRTPPLAIGIAALPNFPGDYVGQLGAPFRWKQINRAAGRGAE
jgi:sterol desaturase/sphingolipid hydroxylase (fatty acid hydroxylase superfamily)